MKKILLLLTILTSSLVLSQKETNGRIYIEHPAIEIVDQFTKAYVAGDLEKIKELVTDDVQVITLRDRTPRKLNWILGTSNYLSKNFVNFNIKHYGGSYPDVLEYKQDNPILNYENPSSDSFDASLIWAPVMGRRIYFGLRYKLPI